MVIRALTTRIYYIQFSDGPFLVPGSVNNTGIMIRVGSIDL